MITSVKYLAYHQHTVKAQYFLALLFFYDVSWNCVALDRTMAMRGKKILEWLGW